MLDADAVLEAVPRQVLAVTGVLEAALRHHRDDDRAVLGVDHAPGELRIPWRRSQRRGADRWRTVRWASRPMGQQSGARGSADPHSALASVRYLLSPSLV